MLRSLKLQANSVSLDRLLANLGPDANDARQTLRTAVSGFNRLTLGQNDGARSTAPEAPGQEVLEAIQNLPPQTDSQRTLKDQALGLAIQMGQMRWLMFAHRAIPVPPFLLGCWSSASWCCS